MSLKVATQTAVPPLADFALHLMHQGDADVFVGEAGGFEGLQPAPELLRLVGGGEKPRFAFADGVDVERLTCGVQLSDAVNDLLLMFCEC